MSFWGWVGAIAAGWFTASILLGIAWGLVGKRIFRKPPQPLEPYEITFTGEYEIDRNQVAEWRRRRGEW